MRKLYFLILFLVFAFGCKPDYVADVTELQLAKVQPYAACSGYVVKVYGRNFSNVLSENSVTIGGEAARVIEADEWTLSVVVPDIAPGRHEISVEAYGQRRGGLDFLCVVGLEHEYTVSVLAGAESFPGSEDGVGSDALLNMPEGLVPDGNGGYYIIQRTNPGAIRKMTADGVVTTVVTSGEALNYPWQGALSPSGELYICNKGNHKLLKMDSDGNLTAVEGLELNNPMGIAFDSQGNGYIASRDNNKLIKFKDDIELDSYTVTKPTCVTVDLLDRPLIGTQKASRYIWTIKNEKLYKLVGNDNGSANLGDGLQGNLKGTSSVGDVGGIFCACDGSVFFTDQTAKSVRKLNPDSKGDYAKGTLRTIATGFFPSDVVAHDDLSRILLTSATSHTVRVIK